MSDFSKPNLEEAQRYLVALKKIGLDFIPISIKNKIYVIEHSDSNRKYTLLDKAIFRGMKIVDYSSNRSEPFREEKKEDPKEETIDI